VLAAGHASNRLNLAARFALDRIGADGVPMLGEGFGVGAPPLPPTI
jgi:hypothetical protein